MLQLEVEKANILKVGTILAKHNVEANITNQRITINGTITDKLLTEIQNYIEINSIKNFKEEDCVPIEEVDLPDEKDSIHIPPPDVIQSLFNTKKSIFYSGIYLCDFGTPFSHEIGFFRPAIVVMCPWRNIGANITTVIPCTTTIKKSTEMNIKFTSETTLDCAPYYQNKETSIIIEQIRSISVDRIKKYIGVLKPEVMEVIHEKIRQFLYMNTSESTEKIVEVPVEKIVEKTIEVPVEKVIEKTIEVTKEIPIKTNRQDINIEQLQILRLVNTQELFDISKKNISDHEKATEILKIFGFNLDSNGVQYLIKAIVLSPRDSYFNLETLVEKISQTEVISKEKIKNLIVARIKETLKFKKSPTISFIRLVNIFLDKQEEN